MVSWAVINASQQVTCVQDAPQFPRYYWQSTAHHIDAHQRCDQQNREAGPGSCATHYWVDSYDFALLLPWACVWHTRYI
jgi:hypothetical protein